MTCFVSDQPIHLQSWGTTNNVVSYHLFSIGLIPFLPPNHLRVVLIVLNSVSLVVVIFAVCATNACFLTIPD